MSIVYTIVGGIIFGFVLRAIIYWNKWKMNSRNKAENIAELKRLFFEARNAYTDFHYRIGLTQNDRKTVELENKLKELQRAAYTAERNFLDMLDKI